MTSISDIAPRLQKLLLMLSSPNSGEVVNAARAIERTLREAGADWHDLVNGLLLPANVKIRAKAKAGAGNSSDHGDWRVTL